MGAWLILMREESDEGGAGRSSSLGRCPVPKADEAGKVGIMCGLV